jgi:hypothetical protein
LVMPRGVNKQRAAVADLTEFARLIAELNAELSTAVAELAEIRRAFAPAAPAGVPAATLSAHELVARWNVSAPSEALVLAKLARRCRERLLHPLANTRGWGAVYRRADVERAERYAAGE